MEDGAHFPAGQVCAEAEVLAVAAEGEVVVGLAADVELVGVVEDVLVAVGGGVPEHDGLALADGLAAQLYVLDGGALELDHDGGPAQDFLDGGGHQLGVRDEVFELVGVVEQRLDAAGDRVAGRLVAGGQQQHEVAVDFGGAQLPAVHLGAEQVREEVVAQAVALPLGDQLGVVVEPLGADSAAGLAGGFAREAEFRIVGTDQHLGPLEDLVPVFLGDAAHVADCGDGQLGRQLVHQVDGGALAALGEAGDDAVGESADVVLGHFGEVVLEHLHHAGGEVARDQPAVLAMLGRVHVNEVGRVGGVAAGEVGRVGALLLGVAQLARGVQAQHLGVGEQLGMGGDVADVSVFGDRPERLEAGALVPVDGRLAAQQVPLGPGVAVVAVAIGVGDVQRVDVQIQAGGFCGHHCCGSILGLGQA